MHSPDAATLVEDARRAGIVRFSAGAIVHRDAGREILLLRRRDDETSFPGAESLPSGGVEPGEALFEGLARELREEIGLPAGVPLRLEPFVSWFDYESRHGHRRRQFTFARPHDGTEVLLSKEHTDFRWIPAVEYGDSDLTVQVKAAVGAWLEHRGPRA
ncbi:NUDIX hydrolase [Nocardiopsis sp. MG754419]|uniref:NUDIX hydrolase n=1 Tax=Nocardiopsis sp. MG754419 TaxID=2259865 RepID=UPI001BA4FCCC|nr:NUDIX hydrolase [Nocardiopsis sp. MG754419]MBR8742560.1 NUDIX domain-containing protein [Nocardiopsis sp. MG754419]